MMGYDLNLIQQRNHDLQRQAQHQRLLRFVRGQRRGPASEVLAWTGRRLVSLGLRLQSEPSRPVPQPLPVFEYLP